MSLARLRLLLLVLMLLSIVLSNTASEISTFQRATVDVNGQQRSYYLYTPANLPEAEAVPLMVVLPPFAMSGQSMAILTGLNEAADRRGFMVVYPENNAYWDDGRFEANLPPYDIPQDDFAFMTTLLNTLQAQYMVDPNRIFLVGYRDSGGMAYHLACRMPERFNGLAVIGSLMWGYMRQNCADADTALNLLIMHSSDDSLYYPQGRRYQSYFGFELTFQILGVEETLLFWLQRNGCNMDETIVFARNRVTLNTACRNNSTIAYYNMRGAGDIWPRQENNQLNRVGIDATEILVRFLLLDGAWIDMTIPSESISDLSRSFVFYVPSTYNPAQPMPLVVMLHMRNSDGPSMAYISGLNHVAEEQGFIALYPNAIEGFWNFGFGFAEYEADSGQDDVRFILSAVEDLSRDLNIDSERMYVAGVSNGGFMTLRLACDTEDVFAAYAIVGASQFHRLPELCHDKPPIPLLHIHGTADNDILWDGIQESSNGQTYWRTLPVLQSIENWVEHNQCEPEPDRHPLTPTSQPSETTVEIIEYRNCAEQSEVILYQINDGGHNFPGIDKLPTAQAGNVNMDFYAGDVIWEFFSRHTVSK